MLLTPSMIKTVIIVGSFHIILLIFIFDIIHNHVHLNHWAISFVLVALILNTLCAVPQILYVGYSNITVV